MNDRNPVLGLVHEYNSRGHLLHLEDIPGAFTRGERLDQAMGKIPAELARYHQWCGKDLHPDAVFHYKITRSKISELAIEDADSDILFDSEKLPLSAVEYGELKALVLKSAQDFLSLYSSIPDKDRQIKESRKTFYGELPATASAMYRHTKNVNHYYFGEIGIPLTQNEDLFLGRKEGFLELEGKAGYLGGIVYKGGDGELWSLRKVLRRFIWHDAIHARAMYRSASHIFPESKIENPFCFNF